MFCRYQDDVQWIWPTLRPSERAVYVRERSEGYVREKKREEAEKEKLPLFSIFFFFIDTKRNQVGRTDWQSKNARGFIR